MPLGWIVTADELGEVDRQLLRAGEVNGNDSQEATHPVD